VFPKCNKLFNNFKLTAHGACFFAGLLAGLSYYRVGCQYQYRSQYGRKILIQQENKHRVPPALFRRSK